jgi:hypothetical protein
MTLLTTGAVAAALVLAGCGGGTGGTAAAGSTASVSAGATGTGLGTGSTFVPATTDTTTTTGTSAGNPAAATTGGGATAATTPECRTTNLKLSLGPSDGAAGHVFQSLRFTNVSKVSCVIVGFPGVSYVTGDKGTQVGKPAARDGAIGPQITLRPGQVASATISMTDIGVFDPAVCKPTTTRGFRVYPPDSTASMFVAQSGRGCAGNPPSPQLRVQTIKPGSGDA